MESAGVRADPEDEAYQGLLQRAERLTFDSPTGVCDGSDARLAALEDGERLLRRAAGQRPGDMLPRVMLLRNLMLQDRGREADVPELALSALRQLAADCQSGQDVAFTPAFVPAMQAVLLALKALYKLGREPDAAPFVAAASQLVPSMAADFSALAGRVDATLGAAAAPPAARCALLASHRYLSCVDLQAVSGRHHQGSPGLESVDEGVCGAGL